MATYFGRDGKTKYELDKQLKSGGEGVVYTIQGEPTLVAKIYKPERVAETHIRNATRDKILAMLDMNFSPYNNGRVIVAWPQDVLFNANGEFQGFVMPKVENMKSLIWATRPSDRDVLWPQGYRWSYSLAIAYNLSLTVEQLHKAGIVVGDMNTNNILIDAAGNVTMIDTDSFNILAPNGCEYKCIVGVPEVLPAELQGKNLANPSSQFNEKTDCFSLAIHIFSMLCNNCHPFGCLNLNNAHGSSSNSKIMDNIVKGFCPYVNGLLNQVVDDALDMNVFPDELRILFDRAFHYDASTALKQSTIAKRPTAKEWRVALGNLYSAGVNVCIVNNLHEYPIKYHGSCPWCAIEKRKQKAIQTINIQNQTIRSVQQSTNTRTTSSTIYSSTTTTSSVQNAWQTRQNTIQKSIKKQNKLFKRIIGIGISVILGLLIVVFASGHNERTNNPVALYELTQRSSSTAQSYYRNDHEFHISANYSSAPNYYRPLIVDLNGKYDSFHMGYYLSDGRVGMRFSIYADGNAIYDTDYIPYGSVETSNQSSITYLDLGVSGVNKLELRADYNNAVGAYETQSVVVLNAFAYNQEWNISVFDDARVLSTEEREDIEENIQKIRNKYGIDIMIVTTSDKAYKHDLENCSREYYFEHRTIVQSDRIIVVAYYDGELNFVSSRQIFDDCSIFSEGGVANSIVNSRLSNQNLVDFWDNMEHYRYSSAFMNIVNSVGDYFKNE